MVTIRHATIVLALCTVTMTAQAQTVSDSDFISIDPALTIIPGDASDTNFHIAVMIDHATTLGAISLPISYAGQPELRIDTTFVSGSSAVGITRGPAGLDPAWVIHVTQIHDSTRSMLIGFISFSSVLPQDDTLCYVHFDLDAGGGAATVSIDSTTVTTNHLVLTDPSAQEYVPMWTPGVIDILSPSYIPIPGDVNCDSVVSSADIIFLVNYVFKGGSAPPERCE